MIKIPINRDPILICKGCGHRPTRHEYVEKRLTEKRKPTRPDEKYKFLSLVFRCATCGLLRVYGTEALDGNALGKNLVMTKDKVAFTFRGVA